MYTHCLMKLYISNRIPNNSFQKIEKLFNIILINKTNYIKNEHRFRIKNNYNQSV